MELTRIHRCLDGGHHYTRILHIKEIKRDLHIQMIINQYEECFSYGGDCGLTRDLFIWCIPGIGQGA